MRQNERSAFGGLHPAVLFSYFLSVILLTVFSDHPVLLAASLTGAMLFCAFLRRSRAFLSDLGFYLPFLLLVALSNPLFSHNGVTPLFFLNGNPVTKEALLYGVALAVLLTATAFWCKCWNEVMTSDKTLYLFGRILPGIALLLSASLRFLPLLKRKYRELAEAQTALGYHAGRGILDRCSASLRVFDALISWALEQAAQTGTVMRARGWGLKGRTCFSLFRFTRTDTAALTVIIGLTALTLAGNLRFSYYPRTGKLTFDAWTVLSGAAFALLALLPWILETEEALRWKFSLSKI